MLLGPASLYLQLHFYLTPLKIDSLTEARDTRRNTNTFVCMRVHSNTQTAKERVGETSEVEEQTKN